jgi:hypothetical protein
MKEGKRLLILTELMEDIGLEVIFFIFNWYLKKDLSVDILRLIVLEEALFSLIEASHERTIEGDISEMLTKLY